MSDTVKDLLSSHPADAPALGAAGRDWLTFGQLRDLTDATLATVNGLGIGRGDRLAIVLPNGPEMAAAFVTLACGTTTAPLNPAYREEEYDFYLSDLKAKALVVAEDYDGPALPAAQRQGVRVLRLSSPADRPAEPRERRRQAATPKPTMSAWCCTPRARPRGRRSYRCCSATWPLRPGTSAPPLS